MNEETKENLNSKQSIESAFAMMAEQNPEIDVKSDLWEPMKNIIRNSLSVLRPTIEHEYTKLLGKFKHSLNQKYFQILGYDIMYDEKLQPWVFEINSYPSMNIMSEKDCADGKIIRERSEIDERIKGRVCLDACKIVTGIEKENSFTFIFNSDDYQEDSFELAF
jgi:hypothetical protein